jgi:hypothetical protein
MVDLGGVGKILEKSIDMDTYFSDYPPNGAQRPPLESL